MNCTPCTLTWDVPGDPGTGNLRCLDCGHVYAEDIPFTAACAIVDAHIHAVRSGHEQLHQELMRQTEGRPRRLVKIDGVPYLERYFMGDVELTPDSAPAQRWLHRFMRASAEALHGHAWGAGVRVLAGWYLEERLHNELIIRMPGTLPHRVGPETIHRVRAVMPNTWTELIVAPGRADAWHFYNTAGEQTDSIITEGEDWWKRCSPRPKGGNNA